MSHSNGYFMVIFGKNDAKFVASKNIKDWSAFELVFTLTYASNFFGITPSAYQLSALGMEYNERWQS